MKAWPACVVAPAGRSWSFMPVKPELCSQRSVPWSIVSSSPRVKSGWGKTHAAGCCVDQEVSSTRSDNRHSCSATVWTVKCCVFRKVHHVRKQLVTLSSQLISIEKEVTMLMERAIKVRRVRQVIRQCEAFCTNTKPKSLQQDSDASQVVVLCVRHRTAVVTDSVSCEQRVCTVRSMYEEKQGDSLGTSTSPAEEGSSIWPPSQSRESPWLWQESSTCCTSASLDPASCRESRSSLFSSHVYMRLSNQVTVGPHE